MQDFLVSPRLYDLPPELRIEMKKQNMFCLFFLLSFLCGYIEVVYAKIVGTAADGNLEYVFSGMLKPEMFFINNATLLNKNLATDKFCFAQHTLDLRLQVAYGKKKYEKSVVDASIDIRNKSVWGSPESIASTLDTDIKILDTVTGSHSHGIPRQIFWIRGVKLTCDLPSVLGLSIKNNHELSLGLFPLQLGRGISLGEAYQIGPDGFLGAFTYNVVNQYAPTVLIHGELVKDILEYDVFALTLNNKATNMAETGAKILGAEFGQRNTPERGFGKINYIVAGRLMWYLFNNDTHGSLTLEPYGLF